ncbi:carboxypeptidase-like regulatory domain-containing protein [Algoriphagus machipongonensis]|uniref:Outer membrane protein n=1 Tax=Algoriphagus machipongonensis TaxID=388413 RepID=A3I221_9BACT|nr:carboxypeptidase-like regulatory domain-containing protein [Algoriphagus machipongonensis]EAZ79425.1 outer membrane protein [Algoriphagus machipongonensis]
MKNSINKAHKLYQRKLKFSILTVLFLFLGGLAFSITQLTSAGDGAYLEAKKIVKGIVLSQDKSPLPGAIIIVKNEDTGTVTDIKGNFYLDLEDFTSEEITLQISMIDHESTDVVLKTKNLPKDLGKITLKKEAK